MSTASPHLPASTSAFARLRRWRPEISTETLILLSSAFFALACNGLFWRDALATNPGSVLFAVSLFIGQSLGVATAAWLVPRLGYETIIAVAGMCLAALGMWLGGAIGRRHEALRAQ